MKKKIIILNIILLIILPINILAYSNKIIIGGIRSYDYKVRLLLAGINPKKIFIEENEFDTYKHLSIKNIDKIVIIHDIYMVDTVNLIVEKLKDVIK